VRYILLVIALGLPMVSCTPAHATDIPREHIRHLTPTVDLILQHHECVDGQPQYGNAAYLRFNSTGKTLQGCWGSQGEDILVNLYINEGKKPVQMYFKQQQFSPVFYY
jgi:hypothetical protein